MRLPTVRLLAVIGVILAGAASAAGTQREAPDDAEAISQWTAPPYWTPPSPGAEAHSGGRHALAGGPTALPFIALFPCRLVDTRAPAFPAPLGGGFLPAATVRSYTLAGVCNVPASAQAISLNVTVVKPAGPGFITLWPQGGAFPPVSTLNFLGNDVIVNAAVVPLSATGGISIALGVSGGDVILDTNGYYASVPSVTSVNTLSGDVTLSAGSNVTITPSGQTLTISAAGGGGGGGTVTSVGTGSGLTGGPITTAGTVSVAPLGITTGMLANNAVTSGKLASGAVGLAQIDTSQVQARVAACPPGTTLRSVNADGTAVCRAPVAIEPSISTIDSTGDVGRYTSVKIGVDGLGLISYYDLSNGDLRVAHCSNAACTSATTFTLDSTGDVGQYTSIAVGTDGLGLISYYDLTNGNLKVAHCSDTACTSATTTVLDSAGDVGQQTSIAIGTDGLGLISYYDATNGNLKVAHCSNTACTSATMSTLDSAGDVGRNTSIAIGADGLGLISYQDFTNGNLKVAHCSNVACTSASLSTIAVGEGSSIALGTDGLGLISYVDNTVVDLKVAHCSNVNCSSAVISNLDSAGLVGAYCSIAIGTDGLGLISYYDITNKDLKVARCSNVMCTSATLSTLDAAGFVGSLTSIAIGTDGLGLISYYDFTNGDLKVARLGTGGSSVNGLAGPVTITGGGGTTVTSSGNSLTVTSPPAWGLSGNAGTSPGTNFLGTTDGQPLVLQSTGGVGVNMSAPSATLDVAGNLHVNVPASGTPISAASIDVQSFGTFGNAAASHYFRVRDIGSGSPSAFFIRGDGKIGVGTEAPEQNLHVHGTEVLSTGVSSGFRFRERGGASSADDWVWYSEGNVARLWRAGVGTLFTVDGLGITSTQLLSIGALSLAGSTHLCINALTQVATCSSSLRYKTNIAPLHSGLNVVRQLHPISFDWKTDGSHDVGFGAEDVAAIDPLFVTTNAKGDIEGVKYDRLSTVFVNAFQEQQAAIEKQDHRIEKQEREIKRQQLQIDSLKKLVCADHPVAEVCVP